MRADKLATHLADSFAWLRCAPPSVCREIDYSVESLSLISCKRIEATGIFAPVAKRFSDVSMAVVDVSRPKDQSRPAATIRSRARYRCKRNLRQPELPS
jgi:hypothetical protein